MTQSKTSLVLCTCRADMTSKNGFKWPAVGEVATAPDWKPTPECGNGPHGWLYGQGDYSCGEYLDETAKWLVVEVITKNIVMIGGKCKFERGVVRFIGDKKSATDFLIANEPQSARVAVIGATVIVGDTENALTGYKGTATAGAYGTICIKYWDSKNERYRTVVGYTGEDGIEANVAYKLDYDHKFVRVA